MLKKTKDIIKKPSLIKKKTLWLSLLLVSIIVISGFFVYKNFFNKEDHRNIDGKAEDDPLVKAVKFEEKYKNEDKENLDSGDYESYQFAKFNYVENYIKAKEYKKATDILEEVQKSVPADKLATEIYIYWADLSRQQGNNEDYKKYTQILIDKLTQEKRSSEADYYKNQLKESGF